MKAATGQEDSKRTVRPGPLVQGDEVTFRVWAPEREQVFVVMVDANQAVLRREALEKVEEGYFSGTFTRVESKALYGYQLDRDPQIYPDPASNFQPLGVFGPSQVLDHESFQWSDRKWRGLSPRGQILYELHLGTFTPEGTWGAAVQKLAHLRDLGVTAVQVMPIAAFPGKFGWGYDGVFWFAPSQLYGSPDEVRMFVNRAHELELGVILDVVYNHFGPAGNFVAQFSPYYFTKRHHTEWGEAINYDGEHSSPVRDFVISNAAYWISEYHFDGLRLDAAHAIADDSPEHIVLQLARAARAAACSREIVIFAEDEKNRCRTAEAPNDGGWGLSGIYNDDFHHACRVAATGNNEAYYQDYAGSPQEIVSAVRRGHLYQGQWNARQGRVRGQSTRSIQAWQLVHFLQNHDQVANSARGYRTHLLTSPGRHRALTAVLLLGPQTPMLFMGQEFGASAPFLYFADHDPELAELVHRGRVEFMGQFPRIKSSTISLPLPAKDETFRSCKLNWDERDAHHELVGLHRDLIALRTGDPVFREQDWSMIEGAVVGMEAFLLRWFGSDGDDRLMLVNLGRDSTLHSPSEPLLAPPSGSRWKLLWSSEEACYGGAGTPPFDNRIWPLPGHAATVLSVEAVD